jgi:processing peptidase subunit alpha
MAVQSTEMFEDKDQVMSTLDQYGGIIDCQGFRDAMIYCVSAYSHCLPEVMKVLGEVIWRPKLTVEELEQERNSIMFELQDLHMRADPEPLLQELIHQAAFRDNTLGLPYLCPEDNVGQITRDNLVQYVASHYTPDNMILSGAGVDHEQLVELAEEYFVNPKTSWEGCSTIPVDGSIAQYTGGRKKMKRDAPPIIGPNPLPDLNYTVVGLKGPTANDADVYAYIVMNSLMGGGSSFSAGGPGKGMYTQLYLDVLNQYHWAYSAQSHCFCYSDSGLFTLSGSAAPHDTSKLVEVLCTQFFSMANTPGEIELKRAKKQLQSNLMMNLESKFVQFEDIGRQIMEYDKRLSLEELCDRIESVTASDLKRIGEKMLHSPTSYAVLGVLKQAPELEDVEKAMTNGGKLPKKSRLFSFS